MTQRAQPMIFSSCKWDTNSSTKTWACTWRSHLRSFWRWDPSPTWSCLRNTVKWYPAWSTWHVSRQETCWFSLPTSARGSCIWIRRMPPSIGRSSDSTLTQSRTSLWKTARLKLPQWTQLSSQNSPGVPSLTWSLSMPTTSKSLNSLWRS